MTEATEIARERLRAAEVLREHREEVLRRWLNKISVLARERGVGDIMADEILRRDATEFLDLLINRLGGEGAEADMASFYHLILDGREYHIRLADIAYVLLEIKSVGKQVIFENVGEELTSFRVARVLDDTVEAILRKTTDLYELAAEADYSTARERLQEIFMAWDLEAALASALTPAEVCEMSAERLGGVWDLLGSRWRFYDPSGTPRDFRYGAEVPVPLVKEQRQYLTDRELESSGTITALEQARRRRACRFYEGVAGDERIANSAELQEAGVESFVAVPLVARDRVVGVLLMYGADEDAPAPSDERRLEGLAGVMALALDRTGRMELSHKRLSESEVIARIGRALLELPTREELLDGVAGALRDFRDYFDVSVFWVDQDLGQCVLVAEAGRDRRYRSPDYAQPIGEGYIGICAETGETIRAGELEDDERRLIAFPEECNVRTELSVPVKKGKDVLGVIHILSDRRDDFPESEVAALEHVAPHIGVALQNARMIDQREHDQYQIEQARRHMANIIRSTAVGITSSDTRGVYTHWSPSCETMLGYSAAEVTGRKDPREFAAEPFDLQALLRECLREGSVTRERPWVRKDGQARIIRETRVPMQDESGRHIGFTSYLVDVTEQKRAEEQLRRERDTLQLVVDAVGAGLAVYDDDLRLRWANSTLMKWFDFDEDDFGKPCRAIYVCGPHEDRSCPARRALATGKPQRRVHETTDAHGVWHCYEQVFTPIQDGETRLIALSLDITEQRRQTEQMRLISKLTEKVETSLDLERVLHLVLTCVTAGHAIGFNRAFVFLLDEEGEWLEGKMAVGPVSPDDARRIWQDLDESVRSIDQLVDSTVPSASDRELTERVASVRIPVSDSEDTLVSTLESRTSAHVGDAGSDPHLAGELARKLQLEEYVCVPLAAPDEQIGVMVADNKYSGTPIDRYQVELLEMFSRQASLAISNARAYERIRSQLEELRRTRDKLIEAERMASVGRMAGHLAHEIRNPLTAIGGFARSIARRHEEDTVTHRNANIIYEEARRLERTLVNVLDYTRPLRPDKKPVRINEIVRDTVGQFRPQLEEEDITVRFSLREDLPAVSADGEMIKQVILNLIKNAKEATENKQKGKITVSTDHDGDSVLVSVADNGAGMPPDVVENLFSPFFTTKIGGIGLGLSVSRRIVRQHGGDMEVESELGGGSRFTVSLPVDANKPEGGSSNDANPVG
ncbi:MAG: GAF domain-containing protein [Candidatus Brocadiia bacterium]